MLSTQTPGIQVAEQKYTLNSLHIDSRCVTGFVGIAERGPLHEPTHITSFDEYLRIFGGFDTAGNLPYSVYSYFKCGGAECIIVRVANEKYAARALVKIKCNISGTIVFEANSEGVWGNYISVQIWHEGEQLKDIERIDRTEGAWLTLNTDDTGVNDVLRISFHGQRFFRTIVKQEKNTFYFDKPLKSLRKIINPATDMKVEKAFMSIAITCKGKNENFLHLSMNPVSDRYYLTYINERSSLCTVIGNKPKGIPRPVFALSASGGRDGIAEMTAKDFIGFYHGPNQYHGLGSFESCDDVSLIAVPDIYWLLSQTGKTQEEKYSAVYAVQMALINQAEHFRGRFAIIDIPDDLEGIRALKWVNQFDTSSAAAYYPNIDMIDPLDQSGIKTVRVPPSGAVCGCIVAIDNEKGIYHAPANAMISGAVGLSRRIEETEYDFLYPAGINLLRYFPGRGIKVWGARTLSSDPSWRYINVRRTFSAICKSLQEGTQWAVFETNDKNLRKRLVRQVSGFLLDLWMEGYLAGSTTEQGFFVRCDDELNPYENIEKGILTFEVGLAITKPTEYFRISITAEKEGASVYIKED